MKRRTVQIPDRSGWGQPNAQCPEIVAVVLDWVCSECGGPRGDPIEHLFYESGASHVVDRWINPCGHVDMYADVLEEAKENHG